MRSNSARYPHDQNTSPNLRAGVLSGACADDVYRQNCLDIGRQPTSGMGCAQLDPLCGDPGCCCDFPESGELADPHFAFRANCAGRFIPGAYPLCGDLDENGVVDMSDYNMFLDAFGTCAGQSGYMPTADMDRDGCVTLVDFQMWRNCYLFQGTGCTTDMFDPPCGLQEITIDLSVGTFPPPPTLCGFEMTPFLPDSRPLFENVTDIPSPCPIPGVSGFDPPVNHRRIGSGWMSWSHGYTGDVYYSHGATSVMLMMPIATEAVYFYVEPNPDHGIFTVLVNGILLSDPFTVFLGNGAEYVGVCANPVETVVVSCDVDFAVGEFGITCLDLSGACCGKWAGVCTEDVLASACGLVPHDRFAPFMRN
jgi:hypothetical protein